MTATIITLAIVLLLYLVWRYIDSETDKIDFNDMDFNL